jgi:hypothetical protein
MALVASVAAIHTIFSHPGYDQLRQAIEHASVDPSIGNGFEKFADLQGMIVPLDPIKSEL